MDRGARRLYLHHLILLTAGILAIFGCQGRPVGLTPEKVSLGLVTNITDLGTLGGTGAIASGINDSGQVIGIDKNKLILPDGTKLAVATAFSWTAASGMVALGTLGGYESWPKAVNALGEVVGYSDTVESTDVTSTDEHAFYWTAAGGLVDLGTLGGSESRANDVNDLGQVVGSSRTATWPEYHAFLWTEAGGMVDLGTLGGQSSDAVAINDVGQVAGTSSNAAGDARAFLWTEAGGMVELGTLGGPSSTATAINNLGQVIGYSTTASGTHAFLWTSESGMVDLGTLGGPSSKAYAINDLGQVTGSSDTAASGSRGFFYSADSGMIQVGDKANDINDHGHVVGCSESGHALFWTIDDGIVDLGNLGGSYSCAHAVNNVGQAAGRSDTTTYGEHHAALWTIVLTPPTPEEQVEQIEDDVDELADTGSLSNGDVTALSSKLNAIAAHIAAGRTNAALNLLQAFINQVEAYIQSGRLTLEEGQPLTDAAEALLSELEGQ